MLKIEGNAEQSRQEVVNKGVCFREMINNEQRETEWRIELS